MIQKLDKNTLEGILDSDETSLHDLYIMTKDAEQKTGGYLDTRTRHQSFTDNNIDAVHGKLKLLWKAREITGYTIHYGSGWIRTTKDPYSPDMMRTRDFLSMDPFTNSQDLELKLTPDECTKQVLEGMAKLRMDNTTRHLRYFRFNRFIKEDQNTNKPDFNITTLFSSGRTRMFNVETFLDYVEKRSNGDASYEEVGDLYIGDKEFEEHADKIQRTTGLTEEYMGEIVKKSTELLNSGQVFAIDFHLPQKVIKTYCTNNPYKPNIFELEEYVEGKGCKGKKSINNIIEGVRSPEQKRYISTKDNNSILDTAKKLRSDKDLYIRYFDVQGDTINAIFSCGGTYVISPSQFLGPKFQDMYK